MNEKLKFVLAEESEDSQLRAVLRDTSMPGDISLTFAREPSYFTGERAGSVRTQTIAYTDAQSKKIFAVGGRSIRNVHVNGAPTQIGYLHNLRLAQNVRGGNVLVRGYSFLHNLHGDNAVPYYLTTILDENSYAQKILGSQRASMPIYTHVGNLITYMIPIRKKVVKSKTSHVALCNSELFDSAFECVSTWNRGHQFSPSYSKQDLLDGSMFPDFNSENLLLHLVKGKVNGTLGIWNQQAFKQTIVADYSKRMKIRKPIYNLLQQLRGLPTLPKVGGRVNCLYGAFISATGNNIEVFRDLIASVCEKWSGKGFDYLILGLVEGNALSCIASSFASRTLKSKIYLVHWKDDNVTLPTNLENIHVEIATL